MPGMRDQDIDISPVGIIKRSVHDLRSDPKWKIQTGYILYGIDIAVWRPYDPEDMSRNAAWRNTTWYQVYTTVLSFDPSKQNYEYETYWLSVDDSFRVNMPRSVLKIAKTLKDHLISIHKSELAKRNADMAKWRAKMRRKHGPSFGRVSDD